MSFSTDWLSVREPADIRARNPEVLKKVGATFAKHKSVTILDLGCGTGSTLRALGKVFPKSQNWVLVDNDPELLAEIKGQPKLAGQTLKPCQIDLNLHLTDVFEENIDIVATSAFLDLVSERWIDDFISELKARKLPFYAALTYDGRANCDPVHPADPDIISAVNRHQRGDKGFGPALGPVAAGTVIRKLQDAGFEVAQGQADWVFLTSEGLVQSMLIEGWASAALELGILDPETIEDWRDWRLTRVADGDSIIRVGHVDVFAVPL